MSSIASRGFLAATRRAAIGEISAPAYGKMVKNAATRVLFFGPASFLVLGWPWVSEKMLNGHVRGGGHTKFDTL